VAQNETLTEDGTDRESKPLLDDVLDDDLTANMSFAPPVDVKEEVVIVMES